MLIEPRFNSNRTGVTPGRSGRAAGQVQSEFDAVVQAPLGLALPDLVEQGLQLGVQVGIGSQETLDRGGLGGRLGGDSLLGFGKHHSELLAYKNVPTAGWLRVKELCFSEPLHPQYAWSPMLPELERVPRLKLASTPTALQEAPRLAADMGLRRLLVKRDDNTGLAFGGNKARKLEYLVADAVGAGADVLLTVGGPQSNHCRSTAAAARQAGPEAQLVFNAPEVEAIQGNLLLDQLLGAGWTLAAPGPGRAHARGDGGRLLAAGPGAATGGSGDLGSVRRSRLRRRHRAFDPGTADRRPRRRLDPGPGLHRQGAGWPDGRGRSRARRRRRPGGVHPHRRHPRAL